MKQNKTNLFKETLLKYWKRTLNWIKKIWHSNNWIRFRDIMGKFSSVGGVISLIILIASRLNLSTRINIVESKIDGYTAEKTLLDYFTLIESGDFTGAYDLLSYDFRKDHNFEGYCNWVSDIVGFEGLKITELPEKNTAISKVFLAEFNLKKRGLIPIESKWGMYVRYLNGKWEINANSVVYEHDWSPTACDFYKFDFCK